ncbi:hypothetical protein DDO73_15185 [Vibrio cholerae]|nr:hypothetical protein [Vibrio cholerae]
MSTNFHALQLDSQINELACNFSTLSGVDLNSVEVLRDTILRVGAPKSGKFIFIELHTKSPLIQFYDGLKLVGSRKILISDTQEASNG